MKQPKHPFSILHSAFCIALAAAALSAVADVYQFIISGDPVAAASEFSCASASSGTALEARYRTWDESDGIALRSTKFRGATTIIVR